MKMFRRNIYVTKRELENALDVSNIDCYSADKTARVFDELDNLTEMFLNRNSETIDRFKMMQMSTF